MEKSNAHGEAVGWVTNASNSRGTTRHVGGGEVHTTAKQAEFLGKRNVPQKSRYHGNTGAIRQPGVRTGVAQIGEHGEGEPSPG